MAADTRDRLIAATLDLLRNDGVTAVSARTVAARAGVNQALVFYHFESIVGLLDQSCRRCADEAAGSYRDQLDRIATLSALLAFGRGMHDHERAAGNVTVMAQMMAAAQQDPVLAASTRYALGRWHDEIRPAVARALRGTLLEAVIDVEELTRAVSSSFVGLELYDTVDPAGAAAAFAAWERLGALAELVEGLAPTTRRLLRGRLERGVRPR